MSEVEFFEMRLGTYFLKLHFFLKHDHNKQLYLQKVIRQATWFFVNTQISKKIDKPETMWPIEEKENAEVEFDTKAYQEKVNQLIVISKRVWQNQST